MKRLLLLLPAFALGCPEDSGPDVSPAGSFEVDEAFYDALRDSDSDEKVQLLQIYSYRDVADYEAGSFFEGDSGREADVRYKDLVSDVLDAAKANVIGDFLVDQTFDGELLHAVEIVEYPNRRVLAETLTDPELVEAIEHRYAAVDYFDAIVMVPSDAPLPTATGTYEGGGNWPYGDDGIESFVSEYQAATAAAGAPDSSEAMRGLMQNSSTDAFQVMMINSLRTVAEYPPSYMGEARALTGVQADALYTVAVLPRMLERGSAPAHINVVDGVLIGDDVEWDDVAIFEFQSREAYVDFLRQQDVRDNLVHRWAGLETAITATMDLRLTGG